MCLHLNFEIPLSLQDLFVGRTRLIWRILLLAVLVQDLAPQFGAETHVSGFELDLGPANLKQGYFRTVMTCTARSCRSR